MLTGSEYFSEAPSITTPTVSSSYVIASGSDAVIGRVTITQSSPSVDTVILYIIDANTAVAMSTTRPGTSGHLLPPLKILVCSLNYAVTTIMNPSFDK